MRGRVVVIAILAVAAIGISLWQPWRDAGPAPADVSPEAVAAGEAPAAAPPPPAPAQPRQEPAPDAGPAATPGARLSSRMAARDAGAAPPAAADDENRARFHALHQAMVTATPEAARLYGAFVRSRVPAPPEAKTLVEMKQRGVPQDELVAFVKSNFPDLPARAIALRWLGVGASPGLVRPPAADPTPATGSLVRRDAG
jgi:hypothetical protein